MNKDTAIILFSRYANDEAKTKDFGRHFGYKKGLIVAKKLISYTLDQCRKTNLPVFTFFPNKQQGNTFGEKLSNCIEQVYKDGFENVIVIGNDCPAINTTLLNQVKDKLSVHKLIIGPAVDGGIYLLGLNKSAYDRNDFINIAWLTVEVSNHFLLYAQKRHITHEKLNSERDIDNFEGVLEWIHDKRKNNIYIFFKLLIDSIGNDFCSLYRQVNNFFIFRTCFDLRGPPLYF